MTPDAASRRIRGDLALEIDQVLHDLRLRREVLRDIWSLHRDRGAFVDTTQTRWQRLNGRELLLLDVHTVVRLDQFYRHLAEFRLYLSFTEDMPATLFVRYDSSTAALGALGRAAIDMLGGVPDRASVTFDANRAEILAFFEPKRRKEPAS